MVNEGLHDTQRLSQKEMIAWPDGSPLPKQKKRQFLDTTFMNPKSEENPAHHAVVLKENEHFMGANYPGLSEPLGFFTGD